MLSLRFLAHSISIILQANFKKDLIKGNRLENNKKDIYYSLTTLGKEVFKIHEILHGNEHDKFVKILNHYDKYSLVIINKFSDDLINKL